MCSREACAAIRGCCQFGPGNPGSCLAGTNPLNCGGTGEACERCPSGPCVNQQCTCDPQACQDGCCSNGPDNPGICLASSDSTCGIGGVQCSACADRERCVDGRCFLARSDVALCSGCGVGQYGVAANSGGVNLCIATAPDAICSGQTCATTSDCPVDQWCDVANVCGGNRCVAGCRA